METHTLHDLKLAGIKWELNEISNAPSRKIEKILDTKNPNNKNIANIPATKPINIDFAKTEADKAKDLNDLCEIIENFNHPLRAFVKKIILPEFNGKDILIITDIPSSEDEENGKILTGGAGELINKMLTAIGFDRKSVSISPLLFWRTPGGRSASSEELDLTKPFIDKIISLLQPKIVLTLGTVAAIQVANAKLPKNHGEIIQVGTIPVMPIYHPNYLTLKPAAKKEVWEGLQKLENLLKNPNK